MPARSDVVECARSYIGVPWRHQGRSREGVDCGGLVRCVGVDLGLLPAKADLSGYDRLPDGRTLARFVARWLPRSQERRPGNVVVLRPLEGLRWPSHMGILSMLPSGELGIVHAYNGLGGRRDGVVETHYAGWTRRETGLFSFPGVEGD